MTTNRLVAVNRWPSRLAAGWSAAAAFVGLWWLLAPSAYPFGARDRQAELSLLAGTTAGQAAVVLLVAGPIGVVLGLFGRGRVVVACAALYAVVFGLVVPDIQLLILLTYLITGLGPIALVVLLVAGAVRSRARAIAVFGGLAALAVAVWWFDLVDAAVLGELVTGVLGAGEVLGARPLAVGFFFAGGVFWAWTALTAWREESARCGWCGREGAAWTRPAEAARWGRWVTIAAAIGPLPYAVSRMTWLLPDGLRIGAPDTLDAEPGLRLWGLLIGFAAFGGSLLTLGLIARWGEVWPRWVPAVRGRAVPPRFPVAFAGTVAVLTTIGGISLTRQVIAVDGDWLGLVAMPLPLWGPLLGAAALAYHYRRRPACPRCGQD